MSQLSDGFKQRYADLVPPSEREAFWHALTHNPPTAMRLNPLKGEPEQLARLVADWPLRQPEAGPSEARQLTDESFAATKTLPFYAGAIYQQELSSMLPPLVLDPQPGEVVVDMTAAPGSKTTQLAAMMRNQGLIIANDKDAKRIKSLAFNTEKYGVTNALVCNYDAKEFGNRLPEYADKVLLDAPCTAEGSTAKDADYFSRWRPEQSRPLSNIQKDLLRSALKMCKVGGTIVYSTCTLAPEENEGVIDWLLREYGAYVRLEALPDWDFMLPGVSEWQGERICPEVSNTGRVLPHRLGSGGFFLAKLTKTASLPDADRPLYYPPDESVQWFDERTTQPLRAQIMNHFGLSEAVLEPFRIGQRGKRLWLIPDHPAYPGTLAFDRLGVPLGQLQRNGIRFSFGFCLTFGHLATRQSVALDEREADRYIRGMAPQLPPNVQGLQPGQVILTWSGLSLGRALFQPPTRLKSQLKKAYAVR